MLLSDIINYGIYVILGIFAITEFLMGYSRGFSRQTVNFIFASVAFAISLLVFGAAYSSLYSFVDGKSIGDLAAQYGIELGESIQNIAVCIRGDTAVYLASVPLAIAVFPFGFLLTFFSVMGLLAFPYIALCGALGFESKYNTNTTRILGAGVGLIQGILVALLILMPVDGMLDVATEAVTYVEDRHPTSNNTMKLSGIYHQNFDDAANNPVLQYSDDAFGFIYDKFSMITVEGEDISVREVADDFFELFVLYGDLGEGFNYKALTQENKDIINKMLDCFGRDHLMTAIASGALSSIGKVTTSEAVLIQIDGPMSDLLMAFLDVCATSDSTTVEGDLETLAEVYYLFSDEGVLYAETVTTMFESFLMRDENGSSTFTRMVETLDRNPRFHVMAETCTKVSMDLLLQNSGVDSDVKETMDNVKGGINDVVALDKNDFETEEEYKAEVNKGITETLKDNGISLSDEKVDDLTDYVIENYGDKSEISDAEFLDFMAKYYDTYGKDGGAGGLVP